MKRLTVLALLAFIAMTAFAQISLNELTDEDLRNLRSQIDRELTIRENKRKNVNTTGYVTVKGGSFRMDNSHTVTVNSFIMGTSEVTQELYESVMNANPSTQKGKKLPVETISWYDALKFCNELSKKEGLTPCYSGSGTYIKCNFKANGYRLPTEAEWEYAARGGNVKSPYEYSGSDNAAEVAWYSGNSNAKTHEICLKSPNALGLYDMSGNVWEWCWDKYGSYEMIEQDNPKGAETGIYRVTRGGGSNSSTLECAVLRRGSYNPSHTQKNLGLRLVRSIP